MEKRIRRQLDFLYGESKAPAIEERILDKVRKFREQRKTESLAPETKYFSQKDIVIITYGDQVRETGKAPLCSLTDFLVRFLRNKVSTVHLLPFFPYSSDDGFAVTDYREVNPDFGGWDDIKELGTRFDLMFDAVINHISRKSRWFNRYLKGDPRFEDYFIQVDESNDLSKVVRPRNNPLLTEVRTAKGKRQVWTTFSSDQVDLNYANPDVLVEVIDVLLYYVQKGAKIIRLDAIAYLWKKSGTSCINLPETHGIVKIFRAVLDLADPEVALITETNVPHEQNVSYFGKGEDEAQLVYQFTLPPLVLHTFLKGNARKLSEWARNLKFPKSRATFFNFLASHDGIGLRPVEGILTDGEISEMVERTINHGGKVSYKADSDEGKSPYELNITYFDALSNPKKDELLELQIDRFMSSQAIMLAFRGVPGVYFNSLVGGRNWIQGMEETGRNRTINREKFSRVELEEELSNSDSLKAMVLKRYKKLLGIRRKRKAFHPSSEQRILDLGKEVFALLRIPEEPSEFVLCIHSVYPKSKAVDINTKLEGIRAVRKLCDLVSGDSFSLSDRGEARVNLAPYQVRWLEGRK